MTEKEELVRIWLSRALVWGGLLGTIYLLRSFSLLMFLVFIFSYIQANAVNRLERWIENRTARAVLVGVAFLAVFVLIVAALITPVRDQTVELINNLPTYAQDIDRQLVVFLQEHPELEEMLPHAITAPENVQPWDFRSSTLGRMAQQLFGLGEEPDKDSIATAFETARQVGSKILKVVSQFLLSLLFSFLIVLDLPNLTRGVTSLQDTKLRYVYDEMADSLVRFGETVGRAFEAQFQIAVFNTILTAIGVWLLGIRGELAFLSLIVFLCSFVPVAGVFVSSVPICLLALAQDGIGKVIAAIVLIFLIHAVEAYILNPHIFGHHLHLNPVLVMILLTISGKLFGVWGLLLSLPIATYIFKDAIQYEENKPAVPTPAGEPEAQADTETEVEESK